MLQKFLERDKPGCLEYGCVGVVFGGGCLTAIGLSTLVPGTITVPVVEGLTETAHTLWPKIVPTEVVITPEKHLNILKAAGVNDARNTALSLGGLLLLNLPLAFPEIVPALTKSVEHVPAAASLTLGILGVIYLSSLVNVNLQARNEKEKLDIANRVINKSLADFIDSHNQDKH